ncbi:type IV secretion system DNA-binding domain-containing protein [Ruminococcus sp.]
MERILTISAPDAASERFATLLMQIFNGGTNQLIVKDKLLILEESAMENVLIPSMRTADNTCRILKCLKACEYLHATKKNRYPLVVYSHHRSLRPALIALKSDRILDSDVELMIEESRYAEWYSTAPAPEHFIPLTENRIGGVSYQVFDEKRKDNMHFFALGKSGSGKTHCLTERMVSLQKLHRPVIVFDTSESFTEEEILEKLSVGCGETAEKDVRAYIAEHITFHRIEEDGIPVDLLKLSDSGNAEDTI